MKTKPKKKSSPKSRNTLKKDEFITVILLCDNPGYRMRSYGPISLVPINSKRLIDIQVSAINSIFPKCEIIICLGFDCEKVCKYIRSKNMDNVRVIENQLYTTTNSCEGLRLCLNNTSNNKVLICDGNLLIDRATIALIDTSKPCALIQANHNETLEIGVNINKNVAQFFSFGAKYIWSEILFLIGNDIVNSLKRVLSNNNSKTKFLFESINELINMNYEIKTLVNKYPLYKINNIKTYHSIKDFVK